jgi:hypothetical protein
MGSPALREHLVDMRRNAIPAASLRRGEFLLVVAPEDPLLKELRERGLSIFPALGANPGVASAGFPGGVEIFFGIGPDASHPPTLAVQP